MFYRGTSLDSRSQCPLALGVSSSLGFLKASGANLDSRIGRRARANRKKGICAFEPQRKIGAFDGEICQALKVSIQ